MAKKIGRTRRAAPRKPAAPRELGRHRNRILGLDYMTAASLERHPKNWRQHTEGQRAVMENIWSRVGIAGTLLIYKSEQSGNWRIIDGELRADMSADDLVPVLKVDVTDAEAEVLLAVHDPVGDMALPDEGIYAELLAGIDETFAHLASLFDPDRDGADDELDGHPASDSEGQSAKFPIAAVYDEGYDAVLIFCVGAIQWASLATALGLPRRKDRNGNIGVTHVLSAREFLERWQSRSSSSATAAPAE